MLHKRRNYRNDGSTNEATGKKRATTSHINIAMPYAWLMIPCGGHYVCVCVCELCVYVSMTDETVVHVYTCTAICIMYYTYT